jgi:hypothetical protein
VFSLQRSCRHARPRTVGAAFVTKDETIALSRLSFFSPCFSFLLFSLTYSDRFFPRPLDRRSRAAYGHDSPLYPAFLFPTVTMLVTCGIRMRFPLRKDLCLQTCAFHRRTSGDRCGLKRPELLLLTKISLHRGT